MTWVAKAVVVVLAALVLVNAQCLAACAVQPCHSTDHKKGSEDQSNSCHQKPGSHSKDKPAGCSHESFSGDAAKKVSNEQGPLLLTAVLVHRELPSFNDSREYAATEPSLLPTVTIASKTVLRI